MEHQNNQLAATSALNPHSAKLICCILKMEQPQAKVEAKMELIGISNCLMPNGRPDFLSVIKYPMIRDLKKGKHGSQLHKILFLLIRDFCNTLNVVRNMNEDMMIEAAGMLLEECGNFRLEDYVMMFQMAKRGELFDIHDRIDLQVIAAIMDAYWLKRKDAGEKRVIEANRHFDSMGLTQRTNAPDMVWNEQKGYVPVPTTPQKLGSLMNALTNSKHIAENIVGDKQDRDNQRAIAKADAEKIKQQLKERGYDK